MGVGILIKLRLSAETAFFYCKLNCRLNGNEKIERKIAVKKERFVSKVISLLLQHTFFLVHFFDVITQMRRKTS